MQINIVRSDTKLVISPVDDLTTGAVVPARTAVLAHPHGATQIVQCPGWDRFVRVKGIGHQISDDQIQSILDEIASADVDPEVVRITVHRDDPDPKGTPGRTGSDPGGLL